MTRISIPFLISFTLIISATVFAQSEQSGVVISQIYGAGGNSGAVWRNDFVELFNRGSSAAVIDGWSIQYASASSTNWQKADLSGRIEPGSRFLIRLAGGSNGAELPAADAVGSINLSATAGKIALVRDTTLLGAGCPPGPQVVDLVGYGGSASCFEGAGPAAAPSAARAILRAGEGCADTGDNSADFATSAPVPRNSGSPSVSCGSDEEPATGIPLPSDSDLSGQKAGSILIYPIYASNPAGHLTRNTRLSLTNTDPLEPVTARLLFFDGDSGTVMDGSLCLTGGQTATFLASDVDPGVTGYLIAVAVDPRTGCPVRANTLIGDAFVKLGGGRSAALSSHAVAAVNDQPSNCSAGATEMIFDGASYNRLPGELAVSNFRLEESPWLVLVRPEEKIGALSGLLFDDAENARDLATTIDRAHLLAPLGEAFRDPPLSTVVPAGRSGWMKFRSVDGGAILGALIGLSEGRNLHVLGLSTTARWIIPVTPGGC